MDPDTTWTRTGKGKQVVKDRDTKSQGKGHKWTETGTQTDRDWDTDRQGQRHRLTGKGTQTGRQTGDTDCRERDTD